MSKKILLLISTGLILAMIFSFTLSGCKEEAMEEETAEETEEVAEETEEVAEEAEEEMEEEPEEETEEIAAEPVTISMWVEAGNNQDFFQKAADMYSELNPNVTFEITGFDVAGLQSTAPAALTSGQEKLDLLWFWPNQTAGWGKEGLIMEIEELYEEAGIWEYVPESQYNAFTKNDTHYSAPMSLAHSLALIYYRPSVFDEYGVSIPTTYDDLGEAIDTFGEAGIGPVALGNIDTTWICHVQGAMMGYYLSPEQLKNTAFWGQFSKEEKLETAEIWIDDNMVDSFAKIKDLVENGVFVEDMNVLNVDQARELWVNGNTAMFTNGSWDIKNIRDAGGDGFDFDYFYWPIPEDASAGRSEIAPVAAAGGTCLYIPGYIEEKAPEKIPVMVDFVRFCFTRDVAIEALKFGLNANSKALTSDDFAEYMDPMLASVLSDQVELKSYLWCRAGGVPKVLIEKHNEAVTAVSALTLSPEDAAQKVYEEALRVAEEE